VITNGHIRGPDPAGELDTVEYIDVCWVVGDDRPELVRPAA